MSKRKSSVNSAVEPRGSADAKPDLDSPDRVAAFIDQFYQALLADAELGPLFTEVAAIDLAVHLPRIRAYWCKLLFGDTAYRRHTMQIHREVHSRRAFTDANFERWLRLFNQTLQRRFAGTYANRASEIAARIAVNMRLSLRAATLPPAS